MRTKFLCAIALLLLVGCGQEESEIAKKIRLRVSTGANVLPLKLEAGVNTCMEEDVEGPRVRMRASIAWSGGVEYGVLVPYIMQFAIDDANLSKYSGVIGPSGEFESISYFFGSPTDFIPATGEPFSSTTCFADYGGLPEPKPALTGRRQLTVRGKILVAGVTRTTTDNTEKGPNVELPFIKEVTTDILYTAGSVPIEK